MNRIIRRIYYFGEDPGVPGPSRSLSAKSLAIHKSISAWLQTSVDLKPAESIDAIENLINDNEVEEEPPEMPRRTLWSWLHSWGVALGLRSHSRFEQKKPLEILEPTMKDEGKGEPLESWQVSPDSSLNPTEAVNIEPQLSTVVDDDDQYPLYEYIEFVTMPKTTEEQIENLKEEREGEPLESWKDDTVSPDSSLNPTEAANMEPQLSTVVVDDDQYPIYENLELVTIPNTTEEQIRSEHPDGRKYLTPGLLTKEIIEDLQLYEPIYAEISRPKKKKSECERESELGACGISSGMSSYTTAPRVVNVTRKNTKNKTPYPIPSTSSDTDYDTIFYPTYPITQKHMSHHKNESALSNLSGSLDGKFNPDANESKLGTKKIKEPVPPKLKGVKDIVKASKALKKVSNEFTKMLKLKDDSEMGAWGIIKPPKAIPRIESEVAEYVSDADVSACAVLNPPIEEVDSALLAKQALVDLLYDHKMYCDGDERCNMYLIIGKNLLGTHGKKKNKSYVFELVDGLSVYPAGMELEVQYNLTWRTDFIALFRKLVSCDHSIYCFSAEELDTLSMHMKKKHLVSYYPFDIYLPICGGKWLLGYPLFDENLV